MNKRLLEVLAMVLVGDGLLTLLQPKRHCLLWEIGPEPLREAIDQFVQHPALSRVAGAAELALGLMIAGRQEPGLLQHLRRP